MVGAGRRKWLLAISMACVFALSGSWFFIGERSHAVMPIMAAAWLWHSRIRRIPAWLLIASGISLLVVVFPVFSEIRNDPLSERTSFSSFQETFRSIDQPLVATLSEMGASFRPVVDTLELVPSSRPYGLGAGYAHAILNIFPNFISFLHFPLEYGTSDQWYVEEIDPATAQIGGAWGFNFIAEGYLEFGWLGAPFALAVLGALIGGVSLWGTNSIYLGKAAAVAAWWVILLHFPRGVLEGYTRQLVWFALIPYLLVCVVAWHQQKRYDVNAFVPA
jgi:oligosaccharide repeat unit polymerase